MQVVIVAVQALLVLFHKRHLNMDIAISASTFFFFFFTIPTPLLSQIRPTGQSGASSGQCSLTQQFCPYQGVLTMCKEEQFSG